MDLRVYYQKLRQIESEIKDPFPVVVSRATADGGKQGLKTQVPRDLAARMIADGKVELASAEATSEFVKQTAEAWRAAQEGASPDAPNKSPRRSAKSSKKP